MDDVKYPERIERMLDVMVCLPKNAWGWVLLDIEKKIGAAALQRIVLRAYQIEKAGMHGKGKGKAGKKRKRQSAINTLKIPSIQPTAPSSGDQLPV